MLVKAPILGGEHRFDDIIGILIDRHGVVVADAAPPHFHPIAVEKCDCEILLLQPIFVGDFAKRRQGQA